MTSHGVYETLLCRHCVSVLLNSDICWILKTIPCSSDSKELAKKDRIKKYGETETANCKSMSNVDFTEIFVAKKCKLKKSEIKVSFVGKNTCLWQWEWLCTCKWGVKAQFTQFLLKMWRFCNMLGPRWKWLYTLYISFSYLSEREGQGGEAASEPLIFYKVMQLTVFNDHVQNSLLAF